VHTIAFIAGLLLVLATLLDGFETILLPRRISHRFRYSRLYYRNSWKVWRRMATLFSPGRWREGTLSAFGPLSLLGLFCSWIGSLILGFTAMQWSLAALIASGSQTAATHSFDTYLYFSGTTYFTLGLGDVVPSPGFSRTLSVLECGLGFGFLAIIISYLPVLYQAFSRREVTISLLDARAGSPPTGAEFLRRLTQNNQTAVDDAILQEWERWCAELLESHISFPVLAFYRSQHANQSWLAALTSMLDSCALIVTLLPESQSRQAQLTFAMARHAAVDIGLVFNVRPPRSQDQQVNRAAEFRMSELLGKIGRPADESSEFDAKFAQLRAMYEPFVESLAKHFVFALPPVIGIKHIDDNWQRSAWMSRTPGIGALPVKTGRDHFD
jgi:hypothetical protein